MHFNELEFWSSMQILVTLIALDFQDWNCHYMTWPLLCMRKLLTVLCLLFCLKFVVHNYQEWSEEEYPTYANGPGYIISADIARFIVSNFEKHRLKVCSQMILTCWLVLDCVCQSLPHFLCVCTHAYLCVNLHECVYILLSWHTGRKCWLFVDDNFNVVVI